MAAQADYGLRMTIASPSCSVEKFIYFLIKFKRFFVKSTVKFRLCAKVRVRFFQKFYVFYPVIGKLCAPDSDIGNSAQSKRYNNEIFSVKNSIS